MLLTTTTPTTELPLALVDVLTCKASATPQCSHVITCSICVHLCVNMCVCFSVPMSRKGLQEEPRAPAQGLPCLPCSSITPPNLPWPDGLTLATWTPLPLPSHFPATPTPSTPGGPAHIFDMRFYHMQDILYLLLRDVADMFILSSKQLVNKLRFSIWLKDISAVDITIGWLYANTYTCNLISF